MIGAFHITYNSQLRNLQGLGKLTSIRQGLSIYRTQLQSLQGLENLTTLGGLGLSFNNQLQNLQGLEKVTSAVSLFIQNNKQLQDFEGLNNATISRLYVANNPKLTSLNKLNINPSLGELSIANNDQLKDLQGLEKLVSIENPLIIEFNDQLKNLQGLKNLTQIRYRVIINSNNQLQDLRGLEKLTTIGSVGLTITNNLALTSLKGLENIRAGGGGHVIIENNPLLNDCCAIADLLSKTTGEVRIDNGPNCSSVEAIQENCIPTITGFTLVDAITDQDIFDLGNTLVVINVLETEIQLNIRANTSPKAVGSVVFALDNEVIRKENVFPYALFGDKPTGNYHSGIFAPGKHTLTAIPYPMPRGRGEAGMPLTITFEVVEDPLAVARTMTATSEKINDMPVENAVEEPYAEQVWVYPNPTEGIFRVKIPNTAQSVSLTLYNVQGHQVMETTGRVEGVVLDVSHLAAGMYVLKVTTGNMTAMHRILLK